MMDGIYVHILIILGMGTQKHEHSIISLSPSYLSLTLSFHWKIYHRKRSGMGGGALGRQRREYHSTSSF